MLHKLITTTILVATLAIAPTLCLGSDSAELRMVKPVGDALRWIGQGLTLHKNNYVLIGTWGNRASKLADAELKFQFSFKQQISTTNFYFAYTQKSFWRIFDAADSRPFRETNHNPELFYRFEPGRILSPHFGLDIGILEHESNGAREPISRSWNRVYLTPSLTFSRFTASLKLWVRLSEDRKRYTTDPAGDENRDIEDYLGNGELRLGYQFPNQQQIDLLGRLNPATGKGAFQCEYSIPFEEMNSALYFQVWTGYGESLIDYDRSLTRYGVGFRFWLPAPEVTAPAILHEPRRIY